MNAIFEKRVIEMSAAEAKAAGKLGTARLGLGELQGGHLPHLVAQFQLLNGAVQRRKLSLEGRLLGLQPRNGGI